MHEIQPFLNSIGQILAESSKIEEQLKVQGISEDINYSYYNIFSNSLYQFDGEKIIINNDLQTKSTKGI